MIQPHVKTADGVRAERLTSFLERSFPPSKSEFLVHHGQWWHCGDHNRWVIELNGEVAAYCAVMPTAIRIGEHRVEAAWWVDLVVGDNYRGQGLQSAFDSKVRETAPLIVGFPNALAAKIHRRHGWGVREDLEVRLMPLRPLQIARGRAGSAGYRAVVRMAAAAAAPIGYRLRRRLERYEPRCSRLLDHWDANDLAKVFASARPSSAVTTDRDADYLRWRYLDAPYRDELFVVSGGAGGVARVIVVTRVLERGGTTVARILDVFGDLGDAEMVQDALMSAAKYAHALGASQVTAMSASPEFVRLLRSAGFFVGGRARFCWSASDGGVQAEIGSADLHLVLGDSDNDEP